MLHIFKYTNIYAQAQTMGWRCARAAEEADTSWAVLTAAQGVDGGQWLPSSTQTERRRCSQFAGPQHSKDTSEMLGDVSRGPVKRGWGNGACSACRREGFRGSDSHPQYLRDGQWAGGARLCAVMHGWNTRDNGCHLKRDRQAVEQDVQKSCAVSILGHFDISRGKALGNVVCDDNWPPSD